MTYDVSPQLDQRIQIHLSQGGYRNAEDVLSDALDALEQRNADLASIRRGIEDEQAGRVRSWAEVDREIRADFGLAPGQ